MFSRNLAFIIGINNYNNGISSLKTAVNDAQKLVEILREKHNYQVWECLDEAANLFNLYQLLEQTLPEQVTENDRLLFYFAGHGVALNGDDGPAGYLIPQDASQGDTNSYLPMTKLHDALSKLPCRHFLGIFDCCFAGAFRWSSTRDLLTTPEVIHKERYDRFITDPAWQIITSSASDQKALDNFNLDTERGQVGNHSPFAAALLEALEGQADAYPPAKNGKPAGDGVITATELYLYLRDRVEIPTEECNLRQTPGIWCLNKHDKGEYIFLSPGHPLNLPPAPPLDASKNPYRGLESFDEEHRELFFGRSKLVEKLEYFVKANPLTVVLGASGSGKSSLVKAGLIPKLKQQAKETNEKWCILSPIRPGETPLRALNNAIVDAKLAKVELRNKQKTFTQSIAVWSQNNPNCKLLIFIDQSEELITLCKDENERKEFFQQILTAINAHRDKLRVVLSLRSDFEPQFRDAGLKFVSEEFNWGNTFLKRRWQSGRFIVPAMTREELREAIEKPALSRVMYFQPYNLVEKLIDEVDNMPGGLPLLSFALSELYLKYLKRQRVAQYEGITIDRALTAQDYQELGGVIQSLTQRADEEYQALVKKNPDYQQVIRHVMLRMVAVGSGELGRRRVLLLELEYPEPENTQIRKVVERFTDARLLVKGEDAQGKPYVEPAHDALVRGWQKLLEWKQEEEESLILQRRLTQAAQEWQSIQNKKQSSGFPAKVRPAIDGLDRTLYIVENLFNKINARISTQLVQLWQGTPNEQEISTDKTVQFLWNANPYLDVLNEKLNSEQNGFNKLEAEFVERSVLQKRRNVSWRRRIAIAVILVLSGLVITASWQWRTSERGRIEQTAITAEALLSDNPLQGMVSTISAVGRIRSPLLNFLNQSFPQSIKDSLFSAVEISREKNFFEGHQGRVNSVAISADGQTIISGGHDNTVRMWNRNGQVGQPIKAHQKVYAVAISTDGKTIISGGYNGGHDGTLRMWNRNGKLLAEAFKGHKGSVKSIAISADGQTILSGGSDGTVRMWDHNGQPVGKPFKAHQKKMGGGSALKSVAISADGQTIFSGGSDRTVKIWNRNGKLLAELVTGHKFSLSSIAISADGQTIVTGGSDGTVKIWNRNGKLLTEFKAHQSSIHYLRRVNSIAISTDGKTIVTGGSDGTLKMWNSNGQLLAEPLKGHEGSVNSIAISTDGQTIISGGKDGTVRMWDRNGQPLSKSFQAHQNGILSVAISTDGKTILTGGSFGTMRMWNSDGQPEGQPFKGHQDAVYSVAISTDKKTIISGGYDGTLRMWNRNGQPLSEPIKAHRQVHAVAISPDQQTIFSGGRDGTLRMWNRNGQPVGKPFIGHKSTVKSIAISTDGQTIISGGYDGTVRVWNRNGQPLAQPFMHGGKVFSVAISTDGQTIISGGDNGTVRVWNRNGQPLTQPFSHGGYVWSVAISNDAQTIISGGEDGTLRMWNRNGQRLGNAFKGHRGPAFSRNGKTIQTNQGPVFSVIISTNEQTILSGGDDGTLRMWDISFESWLQVACERLRYHPVFKNPESYDEKQAKKTCKRYFR